MLDTAPQTVRIHIVSPTGSRVPTVDLVYSPADTLRDVMSQLVREGAVPTGTEWTFRARDGTVLPPDAALREVVERYGAPDGVLELTLLTAPGAVGALPLAPPPGRSRSAPPAPTAPRSADHDEEDEDEDREVALPIDRGEVGVATTGKKKSKRSTSGTALRKAPLTERRATVRYYSRMNPDRMFPLLVILSAQQIQEIVKATVKQAVSESFEVEEGSTVEVEPVLPGCDCYPLRHALAVGAQDAVTETFWIVPRVLGRVHGARVLVRQGDRVLAEVPLDVKVAKQTLAVACGLLSLAAPYLTMGFKSLRLDYESQKADGFPLYQRAGNWVAETVRPEWMGLGFLGLALALYLWMRPRRRDVFWDVNAK
jgi:hypothetical protein